MGNKNNTAIMSVLIALIALMILILSLAFVIMSYPATRAKVENIVEPLKSSDGDSYGNIINIHKSYDDDDDDDDEVDEDPVISGLMDMTLTFGETRTLDLDNYASDDEDSHSELEFTIIYTASVSPNPLTISIDNTSHVLTITESNGAWEGTQAVTIRVEDTDGNRDEDSFIVTIDNGTTPGPTPTDPVVSGLPDITFAEDTSDNSIDLDNYVTDPDNTGAEMTWTFTGNTNIVVSIGSDNVVTFTTLTPNWNGVETITFRATDPDSNWDEDTITVTVTPVDDNTVWQTLSDQTIDEDSPVGTVVYDDIISRVSDVDGPVTINVASSNTHFTLNFVGDDLILTQLNKNWYGSETVTLEANGQTASFTLDVSQLMDDCIEICSYSTCYTYCD